MVQPTVKKANKSARFSAITEDQSGDTHLTRATYSPGSNDEYICKGQFQITVRHVTMLCTKDCL